MKENFYLRFSENEFSPFELQKYMFFYSSTITKNDDFYILNITNYHGWILIFFCIFAIYEYSL